MNGEYSQTYSSRWLQNYCSVPARIASEQVITIHQDLDERAMDLIVEAVKKARRSARSSVSVSSPAEA